MRDAASMAVLWAHDHVFRSGPAGDVLSFGFPSSVWERYFTAFDRVRVVGRHRNLSPEDDVRRLSRSDRAGVDFTFLPSLSSVRGLLRQRSVARRLDELIGSTTAVIARLPSEIGFLAVSRARRLGVPYAVEVVGNPDQAYGSLGTVGRLYAPIVHRRLATVVRDAPYVLYVTERVLQEMFPTRGRTVGCSNVILPDFDPDTHLRARLASIGKRMARGEPLNVGTIASLNPRKGIDVALEALALARERIGPFTYRVAGPGDPAPWQREAARLGIGDRVEFCGTIPSGDPVLRWLDDQDLYLQPSLAEGLPRTLVEAMSRGCPSLASNVDGIQELLPPAWTHRPGDVRTLARHIVQLVSDPEAQARRAAENVATAFRYRASILSERRRAFWGEFAEFATRERSR